MADRRDIDELNNETERLRADRERKTAIRRNDDDRMRRLRTANAVFDGNERHQGVVHRSAGALTGHRARLEWFRSQRANWDEKNFEFAAAGGALMVENSLWLASPFAIIAIDAFVLSYAGKEIAKGAAELVDAANAGWVSPFLPLTFSAAYLVVDILIGSAREKARENGDGDKNETALGWLAFLTLPVFVTITAVANSGILSSDPTRVIGTATMTMAIAGAAVGGLVALLTHGFSILLGSRIIQAGGFWFYKIKRFYLSVMIARETRLEARAIGNVGTSVRGYYAHYQTNRNINAGDADAPPPGPFSAEATRVVNEVFGDEIIEEPGGRDRNARPREPHRAEDPQPGEADQTGEQPGAADAQDADEAPDAPDLGGYDMDGEDEVRR